MTIIHDLQQGTPEWHALRNRVKHTASDLAAIRGPLQVVLGERSTTSDPRRTRDRLATVLPQTPLTVIPGAGHVVSTDDPEAVNRLVLDFIARVEAA